MPFNFDRLLAVLGIVLAIPGIFPLFHSPGRERGFLIVSLVCIVIAYSTHLFWWEYVQPSFTHIEVDKTLVIADLNANIASVETRIVTRVSHSGITQLWFRGFQPGSQYQNVLVDGNPPSSNKTKAGGLEFCKEFDRPLSSRQVVTVTIKYDVQNAFPVTNPHEFFVTHIVATKTKKLNLKVRFHASKLGQNVKGYISYGSSGPTPDKPLVVNAGVAEYAIDRPKIAHYTIEWNW